ncbi:MAG: COG0613, Predicted metal-dependent phosphoesterases (PHP family) [uncultured Thermomicrobiales bacterium]|uniref:COG0613, Predicted metal-dependent phosphoesterases (PHP family) n=1 Tax=uncultured Thermomicrobiales bacterium TaxID=1645740 RepID=A0A6J4ULX0_9BACT|nr:MAG: COG0613, Predicted metal-dependent phosphoesterases (PHP family) [uncultured Thermomicrobiales bacterium]
MSSTDQVTSSSTAVQDAPVRLSADAAVDLHLHTFASDGFWDPTVLVGYLAEHGFAVAAVCDHDTQDSVLEAIEAGEKRGVHIVPGTEVTVRWGERQWHLLVYGIRPDDELPEAQPFLRLMADQDARFKALAVDARRRVEASGRPIPSVEKEINSRTLMPVHVLRAMITDKHVPRLKEAAELVVELGGNFTTDTPLAEVVEAAHQGGGVCIIAHPGRADLGPALTAETLDRMLAEVPVDGLEGHYRTYSDADTERYRAMAEERGLLIGIGSDSHAPGAPVDPRPWRAVWGKALLERLGFAVDDPLSGAVWEPGMDPLAIVPKPEPVDPSRNPSPSEDD